MKKRLFAILAVPMFFSALNLAVKVDSGFFIADVYAVPGKGKGAGQDKEKKPKKDKGKGPSVPALPMAAAVVVGIGALGAFKVCKGKKEN